MNPANDVFQFFRPTGIPYALLVLILAVMATRVLQNTLDRLGRRLADKRLLIHQVGSFIRFAIYLAAGIGMLAALLVLNREVLLAVGGTVAVATGIALKDVVASLVAGLIILVDKPFQVGDRVSFEKDYGEITFIGLRSVRLMTLDNVTITIPNNKFLTEVVASGNAGHVEMMIRMNFYIGVDQDVALAKRVVREALTTSRYFHLQRPWNVSVTQLILDGYMAIQLGAKAYILDTRFENAFKTDVTEAVLIGLRDAGVEPPAVLERKVGGGRSLVAPRRDPSQIGTGGSGDEELRESA